MNHGRSDPTKRSGTLHRAVMCGNGMGDSVAIGRQETPSEGAIRLIKERASMCSQAKRRSTGGGQTGSGVEQDTIGNSDSTRPEHSETDVQGGRLVERLKSFFFPNYDEPPPSENVKEADEIYSKTKQELRRTISMKRDRIVSMSQPPPALEKAE